MKTKEILKAISELERIMEIPFTDNLLFKTEVDIQRIQE